MAQLLAWTLFKRFRLSEASMPFLRRLSAETGETAAMTTRLGWYGLRIAVAYGNNDIYHRDRSWGSKPAPPQPAGKRYAGLFQGW